ncbi:hypothetical protein S40285_10369 [Stachybotrys chlorohalonatus IBT 40285]|uniref:Secreted protein n=1 Tax=Stachybotrys chlorohalonatus (strain IBT 40285) TaxID=1283841 RepID=A0A084Q8S2_STAC4|nr:hypothetical protein S40285_10369 [Stachybotrys chlorohalonata IBT 40285]
MEKPQSTNPSAAVAWWSVWATAAVAAAAGTTDEISAQAIQTEESLGRLPSPGTTTVSDAKMRHYGHAGSNQASASWQTRTSLIQSPAPRESNPLNPITRRPGRSMPNLSPEVRVGVVDERNQTQHPRFQIRNPSHRASRGRLLLEVPSEDHRDFADSASRMFSLPNVLQSG